MGHQDTKLTSMPPRLKELNDIPYLSPRVTIQEGRYRYCVSPNGNIVKFVIAEFLAVEVNIEI